MIEILIKNPSSKLLKENLRNLKFNLKTNSLVSPQKSHNPKTSQSKTLPRYVFTVESLTNDLGNKIISICIISTVVLC